MAIMRAAFIVLIFLPDDLEVRKNVLMSFLLQVVKKYDFQSSFYIF